MLFESLKADDEVSAIERDLMRDHLRRLYDCFVAEEYAAPTPERRTPKVEVLRSTRKASAPTPSPPPEPTYTPPRIIEIDEELEEMEQPPAPPKAKPAASKAKAAPAPRHEALDEEVAALFKLPKGGDMAAKLGSARIDDLNRAMGLNERFLTRDELFGGSDADMKDTLQTLNGFTNFAEAKQWLVDNVIPKYNWTAKNRRKKAQVFIKLVSRRYPQ